MSVENTAFHLPTSLIPNCQFKRSRNFLQLISKMLNFRLQTFSWCDVLIASSRLVELGHVLTTTLGRFHQHFRARFSRAFPLWTYFFLLRFAKNAREKRWWNRPPGFPIDYIQSLFTEKNKHFLNSKITEK